MLARTEVHRRQTDRQIIQGKTGAGADRGGIHLTAPDVTSVADGTRRVDERSNMRTDRDVVCYLRRTATRAGRLIISNRVRNDNPKTLVARNRRFEIVRTHGEAI